MPWECFSESESQLKRRSKESGWSVRVRCRIEYMVRNENAAGVGPARTSCMKVMVIEFDSIERFVVGRYHTDKLLDKCWYKEENISGV